LQRHKVVFSLRCSCALFCIKAVLFFFQQNSEDQVKDRLKRDCSVRRTGNWTNYKFPICHCELHSSDSFYNYFPQRGNLSAACGSEVDYRIDLITFPQKRDRLFLAITVRSGIGSIKEIAFPQKRDRLFPSIIAAFQILNEPRKPLAA
jgi:hypothetical protein